VAGGISAAAGKQENDGTLARVINAGETRVTRINDKPPPLRHMLRRWTRNRRWRRGI